MVRNPRARRRSLLSRLLVSDLRPDLRSLHDEPQSAVDGVRGEPVPLRVLLAARLLRRRDVLRAGKLLQLFGRPEWRRHLPNQLDRGDRRQRAPAFLGARRLLPPDSRPCGWIGWHRAALREQFPISAPRRNAGGRCPGSRDQRRVGLRFSRLVSTSLSLSDVSGTLTDPNFPTDD